MQKNDKFELFDSVKLIKPFHDMKVGTIGAIVEKYNDYDFEVEFFDENHDTIDVYTTNKEYIEVYSKFSDINKK